MKCKICGSDKIEIVYKGKIRDGAYGHLTQESCIMYKCMNCEVIWHEHLDETEYYESKAYRLQVNGSDSVANFNQTADPANQFKFNITGMGIFRDKVVADIGCATGSFLDYLSNVANATIGIEPSETFLANVRANGHKAYSYTRDALSEWTGKCDVVTSFDVIEHVDDPMTFVKEAYQLLGKGGIFIIGTPTDYPILRELVGREFEEFWFRRQHPWILGEKTLWHLAREAGFSSTRIQYKQMYGMSNFLCWLNEHKPKGEPKMDLVTDALDLHWRERLETLKQTDYIVAYMEK